MNDKIRHAKGCNCKKSNCLKKYCECYQAGIKCTDLCKCDTCKNNEGNCLVKKRKGNGYAENYNQYSGCKHNEGGVGHQTNSFTFGYNFAYENEKAKQVEGYDERESEASNQSFNANAKNFKSVIGNHYQTPNMKSDNLSLKREKIK